MIATMWNLMPTTNGRCFLSDAESDSFVALWMGPPQYRKF
jgi:hypothetical protein